MGSGVIFNHIKRDRFYLLKHYSLECAGLLLLAILSWNLPSLSSSLSLITPIYLIAGILFGLVCASLLHNTSHNNIKNPLLNRMVGEFCGWWVLYGYKNFVMIHLLHHIHSDEEFDPVNPKDMNFFVFLSAPMRYMIKETKAYLFSVHGKHSDYQKIMSAQTAIFHLLITLRLTCWYLILGQELFFFFYVPGFLSTVAIFAHINYVCHRDSDDGSVEVVNLNHNAYYRFANFITHGGYFHKNHHINPSLFDPRTLCEKRARKSYFTIEPKYAVINQEPIKANAIAKYFDLHNVWGEKKRNLKNEIPVIFKRAI